MTEHLIRVNTKGRGRIEHGIQNSTYFNIFIMKVSANLDLAFQ